MIRWREIDKKEVKEYEMENGKISRSYSKARNEETVYNKLNTVKKSKE